MTKDGWLSESDEWAGYWRLPDDETELPGTLTFDPKDGLELRLIGGWRSPANRDLPAAVTILAEAEERWPLILGLVDGVPITLIDCLVLTSPMVLRPGRGSTVVAPTTALVGVQLSSAGEPAFVAASASIEGLTTWSARTGIEVPWARPDGESRDAIYRSPMPALDATTKETTVRLFIVSKVKSAVDTRSHRSARVEEEAVIWFQSAAPEPLDFFLDLISQAADLVSLCALAPRGVISMCVYRRPVDGEVPTPSPSPRGYGPYAVQIYQRRVVKPEPGARVPNTRGMLATLGDFAFEEVMPRWMSDGARFSAARSMVLGLQYITEGYLETRVVTAVAAAESFHRALGLDPPIPDREFRGLKHTVMNAVPKEYRQWVAERFARNEPSLKERLLDLVARLGSAGQRLIPDPAKWAKAAVGVRNTLAHTGTSDQHEIDVLFAVMETCQAVVILSILQELGLDEHRLRRAIDEHALLRHAARTSAVEFALDAAS